MEKSIDKLKKSRYLIKGETYEIYSSREGSPCKLYLWNIKERDDQFTCYGEELEEKVETGEWEAIALR